MAQSYLFIYILSSTCSHGLEGINTIMGHPELSENPEADAKDAGKASAIASFYPSILYLLQFAFSLSCRIGNASLLSLQNSNCIKRARHWKGHLRRIGETSGRHCSCHIDTSSN